jgi:putative ATPase
MLSGGEDPLYLARRLVRTAMEDIGAADPTALMVAIAAKDAYDFLGSPEGEIGLAQTVVHLATAPKSNAVYAAHKAAMRAAKETGSLMPPAHIRNAPTKLLRDLGYGKGYAYDHDAEEGFSGQNYFPMRWSGAASTSRAGRGGRRRSRSGWNAGRRCATPVATRRLHGQADL